MKARHTFRLALIWLGIVMVAWSIPELIENMVGYARMYRTVGPGNWAPLPMWESVLWLALSPVARIAIGVHLMFGNRWILNRFAPVNSRECPECGYDISKNQSEKCPECGVTIDRT